MIKKILTLPLRVAKKLVGAVTGGGRERPAPSHSKPSTAPKSWTPPTPSKPAPRSDEDDRGHSHSHGHSHDHGHSHSHEPEPPAAPEPPKAAPTPEPPAPKPAPKKAAPKKAEPKAAPKKAEPKAAPKKASAKKAAPKKAAPKKAAAKKATPKKAAPKKAAAKKPEAPAKHGDVKANGIDTPNPNAMKFELSKKCFAQPVSVATRDGADSDWTQAVFAVSGVRTLFAVNDFVTVTKEDNANWANMTGPITEALESNL